MSQVQAESCTPANRGYPSFCGERACHPMTSATRRWYPTLTMQFGSLSFRKYWTHRLIALVVLVGILFASLPIPIASLRTRGPSDTPFPCQSCSCGCATAEQCWTSCCCFSPEERLAWARENGVQPPKYALLVSSAERKIPQENAGSRGSPVPHPATFADGRCSPPATNSLSCCGTTKTSAPCCPGACCSISQNQMNSPSVGSCCESKDERRCANRQCQSSKPATVDARLQSAPEARWVLSIMALRCQGKTGPFTWLPWAIFENADGPRPLARPPLPSLLRHSDWPVERVYPPPTPPPRAGLRLV